MEKDSKEFLASQFQRPEVKKNVKSLLPKAEMGDVVENLDQVGPEVFESMGLFTIIPQEEIKKCKEEWLEFAKRRFKWSKDKSDRNREISFANHMNTIFAGNKEQRAMPDVMRFLLRQKLGLHSNYSELRRYSEGIDREDGAYKIHKYESWGNEMSSVVIKPSINPAEGVDFVFTERKIKTLEGEESLSSDDDISLVVGELVGLPSFLIEQKDEHTGGGMYLYGIPAVTRTRTMKAIIKSPEDAIRLTNALTLEPIIRMAIEREIKLRIKKLRVYSPDGKKGEPYELGDEYLYKIVADQVLKDIKELFNQETPASIIDEFTESYIGANAKLSFDKVTTSFTRKVDEPFFNTTITNEVEEVMKTSDLPKHIPELQITDFILRNPKTGQEHILTLNQKRPINFEIYFYNHGPADRHLNDSLKIELDEAVQSYFLGLTGKETKSPESSPKVYSLMSAHQKMIYNLRLLDIEVKEFQEAERDKKKKLVDGARKRIFMKQKTHPDIIEDASLREELSLKAALVNNAYDDLEQYWKQ